MKANAVSHDFPFKAKHEEIAPYEGPKQPPQSTRVSPINCYNNESPSMFRLDSMVLNKNGYNNPFLDEVIKVDRSEEFKKMEFNRQQINLIDKIKSRREYSQNPKILRYIRSDFDISMQDKRERNLKERNKNKDIKKYTLTEGDANPKKGQLYDETITKLHNFSPKMSYKIKRNLELDNLSPFSNNKLISEYDKENYKTLTCPLEPKKSGYLKNLNDYHISEADKFDEGKVFHFNRKPQVEYNLVKDKIETIQAPLVKNKKWDAFYENFFMLMNAERGYRKKGGLFTEFANRNIGVIEMNKRNDKEKKIYESNNNLIRSVGSIKKTKTGLTSNKSLDFINKVNTKESKVSVTTHINTSPSNNMKINHYQSNKLKTELTTCPTTTERAKKVIEDNNLFKLKDVYQRSMPNHSKETLPRNLS